MKNILYNKSKGLTANSGIKQLTHQKQIFRAILITIISLLFVTQNVHATFNWWFYTDQCNKSRKVEIKVKYFDHNDNHLDEGTIKATFNGITITLLDFNVNNDNDWGRSDTYSGAYGTVTLNPNYVTGDWDYFLLTWNNAPTDYEIEFHTYSNWDWDDDYTIDETHDETLYDPQPPEDVEITYDDTDGLPVLSWTNPTTFYNIEIFRGGTQVATLSKTTTTWKDPNPNLTQEEYKLRTNTYYGACEIVSSEVQAIPPAPPLVAKPAGLSASTGSCDGNISVTWQYGGDTEPEKFVLNAGGSSIDIASDKREYVDNVGSFTSKSYSIKAVGLLNEESTNSVTGSTEGSPSKATNFQITSSLTDSEIVLDWDDASNITKYILKRNSPSGESEYEITGQSDYTDDAVKICEEYTYKLFSANTCTDEAGISGIQADNEPVGKLGPDLTSFMDAAAVDASKAYFPDKVKVDWDITGSVGQIDRFIIERRKLDGGSWKQLATVDGALTYEDINAESNVLYEYKIYGQTQCGNATIHTNELTAIGFRIPYGIVNGHIEYENGVAVKGVDVIAEKRTGTYGKSLEFTGAGHVTVPDDNLLKPTDEIMVEAWLMPTSETVTSAVVDKYDGAGYQIIQKNTDVTFEIMVDGTNETVTAENVLSENEFTHVAGTYDGQDISIFINGEIPFNVTYKLSSSDITALQDLSLPEDVTSGLSNIAGDTFNSDQDFLDAIEAEIGAVQTEVYSKFIFPLAKIVTNKPGTTKSVSGTIDHTASDLIVGSNFRGNIDELRIWSAAKSTEQVKYDHKRILGSDEPNLVAYWRFEEGFGSMVYDASKTGTEFNKNDGAFTGASFSTTIPTANQLGWLGVTDEYGDYTIPFIPYFSTGEVFTLTPRFEQHQFKPGSRSVFIGEGANVVNQQDFTDISSFKVTGTVFYENTFCGVEGALITVDGEVVIKDGSPVMTDQNGEFKVTVPIGEHYVSVVKNNHVFKSYKFPPGPETSKFDFQEDITGINFIDQTKVKIVGRVVGGTIQGNKKPGLGLSVNNIGRALFRFESVTGPACTEYWIQTDKETGEYAIELPPMKYYVRDFSIPKNPSINSYFKELPIADFSVIAPDQTVEHMFEGPVDATVTLDRDTKKAQIDIQGETDVVDFIIVNEGTQYEKARFYYQGESVEYPINPLPETITIKEDKFTGTGDTISTTYNYRHDFIYRSVPKMTVTDIDGESPVTGDEVIEYEDRQTHVKKEFNVEKFPFRYPVFSQGKDYEVLVTVFEQYKNQDMCPGINGCEEAIVDRVPVNDGEIEIYNQLADVQSPAPLDLEEGKVKYSFTGGKPQALVDANFPWRNYSAVFHVTAKIDKYAIQWQPFKDSPDFHVDHPNFPHPDDRFFRGYILGVSPIKGSDFITNGPAVVEMILRDPPGSESLSYLEKGSSFTSTQSFNISAGASVSNETKIGLGTEFLVGMGFQTETDITNDLTIGVSAETSIDFERNLEKTFTVNQKWETSGSPELAGAPSDLFFGSSTNYLVSLADNLTIFPADFANDNGIPNTGEKAGPSQQKFTIGINKALMAAPDGFPTYFIYTADHIENYLIPLLVSTRNNLFVNAPSKYISKIPADHPMYGSNNDDPEWKEYGRQPTSENYVITNTNLDYDGPSYTFNPEDDEDRDQIRRFNEQIRLWEEALARNEMEKYNSELIKNISFDAGPTFEYSTETSITKSYETSFEMELGASMVWEIGGEIGGTGLENTLGVEVSISTGNTSTSSTEKSNTFGYVLHDPDQGDYFSVDVKDPGTGTGPVFSTKGGRSMCPYEDEVAVKYGKPASHEVTDEVITKLEDLGVDDLLLDILSWEERGSVEAKAIIGFLNVVFHSDVMDLIGGTKLKVPQIKGRKFKNQTELRETVFKIIDLHFNLSNDEDVSDSFEPQSLIDMAGNVAGIVEHFAGGDGTLNFYIFNEEQRETLKSEFARYRSFLYDLSAQPVNNPDVLSSATIRREVPVAEISPAAQHNVPEDNKAYFTIQLGNDSHSGDAMWYEVRVLQESNPDGAQIRIDGATVSGTYEIKPGEFINKTLTVAKGKTDIYHYEDLQVAIYSPCEWEYHTNGMAMPAEAIDTVSFSVHFVPSCTNINVTMPDDQFVINYEDVELVDGVRQTKEPVILTGYNMNNPIFERMSFQFKASADPQWTPVEYFYKNPETDDQKPIPGDFTGLEWDLSGFPDGKYQIRAKTGCGTNPDGTEIFDLSEVWTGTVDRKPPQVFGSPQPADGILSPDDDIIIEFNEEIFAEKLTKLENFDIRGILNGTELRHDVSIRFSGSPESFVRIPDGLNLSGKSFTIEFWLKPGRSNVNECILSQNTDPEDALYIGMNLSGEFVFQVGNQIFKTDKLPVSEIIDKWKHMAFVYDHIREEIILYVDGEAIDSGSFKADYNGFGDIVLGKSLLPETNGFKGNIHELRVWESPRTAGKLTTNMLISLSGKETDLIGYWPMDDAYGDLVAEKVHGKNATVQAEWLISPQGYAGTFNSSGKGLIDLGFTDIAFTEEEDFTIEFWFKSKDGSNVCFMSNGHGDENDLTVYYISPESLDKIVKALPLEDNIDSLLTPMLNTIYPNKDEFLQEISGQIGETKKDQYSEQILRYSKVPPTYWSINTNQDGELQVNNNSKRIIARDNYFDNKWHHFALVVQRIGNTRIYIDGDLKVSEPSDNWSAFGGPRFFIGARALWDFGYKFDQYFNGSMDEIRFWNTALRQDQLKRSRNNRLAGDEFALAAYIPFETYKEVMGVPVLSDSIGDILAERETMSNAGIVLQNSDVPNIILRRPVSKVDFDFVTKTDRISFVLNEPLKKIENRILDITAKNVEDLNGNDMTSPVTWSAFIDLNQMKWKEQEINKEKKIYEPLVFTTTIVNSSGQQQNYSIENLPAWLTADPREGTLNPLTEEKITFTVNEGVNIGRYSQNIYLKTDYEFNEKLLFNLRVFKELPFDWEFEAEEYEYSMNVIGRLTIEDVISIDKYDKVSAFVDGECRGIANLQYIEDYDMYEVFLDIYSNRESGERVELRIWDASRGIEYSHAIANKLKKAGEPYQNEYVFLSNETYGTPAEPVNMEAHRQVIQKIPLSKGWNWVSFNLKMDNNIPFNMQLNGLEPSPGDMVKGDTAYAHFSNGWLGTLNYMDNEHMYMINLMKEDTLLISGYPVDTENTPVRIDSGWTYLGYTPQVNIEVNEALARFAPNPQDLVKSQYSFAMYDPFMGWIGSLTYMKPNEGYMFRYMPGDNAPKSQELVYPEKGQFKSDIKKKNAAYEFVSQHLNVSEFSNNMSVIASVKNAGEYSFLDTYMLTVYAGDEIRGLALPVNTGLTDNSLYFLMVYGNDSNEKLTFRLESESGDEIRVQEQLSFDYNKIIGNTQRPFLLTTLDEVTAIPGNDSQVNGFNVHTWPNPFKDNIHIDVSLPGKSDVTLELYDVQGRLTDIMQQGTLPAGQSTLIWQSNNKHMEPGLFFLKVKTKFGYKVKMMTKTD